MKYVDLLGLDTAWHQLPEVSVTAKISPMGPGLILLGYPFFRKDGPVVKYFFGKAFAAGEHRSTSAASIILRKTIPSKVTTTKVLGKKVENWIAKKAGTKALGGVLGRMVPYAGWLLLAKDVGNYMSESTEQLIQTKYNGNRDLWRRDVVGYGSKCFIAGTQITMGDGSLKSIEAIKVGDSVLTYNEELDIIEAKPVLKIETPVHATMIRIGFAGSLFNKNTFDHPYFVKGKGWCSYKPLETEIRYGLKVQKLEVGDTCYQVNGTKLKEIKVLSIKEEIYNVQTYNLSEVAGNNNFFANGVLVHNKFVPEQKKVAITVNVKEKLSFNRKNQENKKKVLKNE